MSEFSRQLRKDFEAKPSWGDVNPLVVIGLTEAILDLALTEDQIYSVIRSYARQLSAQVHPDRKPTNISPERQQQIIGAFDFLDDREHFGAALADFKNLKADDRREVKALGQTISALREQLAIYESKANPIVRERKALAKERDEFQREKLAEPLAVPPLERRIENLLREARDQEQRLRGAHRSAAAFKTKASDAVAYIANMSNDTLSGLFVFKARWVATASAWYAWINNPNLSPFKEDGTVREDLRSASSSLGINEEQFSDLLTAWKRAEKKFPRKARSSEYPLGFSILKLEAGEPSCVFGHRAEAAGGRVIGSIAADKLPIERAQLVNTLSHVRVLNSFTPFLVPEGLLVSVQVTKGDHKASWSNTCPAFRLDTKRFILGVG